LNEQLLFVFSYFSSPSRQTRKKDKEEHLWSFSIGAQTFQERDFLSIKATSATKLGSVFAIPFIVWISIGHTMLYL